MGNVLTTSCADAADVLSSMDDFDFNLLLAAVAAKTQHDEMKGAYDELLDALKREEPGGGYTINGLLSPLGQKYVMRLLLLFSAKSIG